MSLVTNGRARLHPAVQAMDDALLTVLLDAASTIVERYCNRKFLSTAYTETRSGNGMRFLLVNNPPMTAFTNIAVVDDDGTSTDYASTNFRYNEEGLIRPDPEGDLERFPLGFQNLVVTYTGGFATIPEDVQEAVIQVAVALAATRGLLSAGTDPSMKSETLGDYSYTRGDMGGANGFSLFDNVTRQTLAGYILPVSDDVREDLK